MDHWRSQWEIWTSLRRRHSIGIFFGTHRSTVRYYITFKNWKKSDRFSFNRGADIKSATLTPRLVLYPELPSSKLLKESTERSFPTISVWSVPPPILLATPKLSSKLPSPPRKSPDNNFSSGDESCEPIGPPKRRRLSVATNDQPYEVKPFLKPRSASTSSPWTPHFSTDTLSPFLCIEPLHQDVFDNGTSDEDDDLKGVCDEQTLAKSLRKIAKAFQSENVWTAWKTKPFHF